MSKINWNEVYKIQEQLNQSFIMRGEENTLTQEEVDNINSLLAAIQNYMPDLVRLAEQARTRHLTLRNKAQ